jgi:hypothetical protein
LGGAKEGGGEGSKPEMIIAVVQLKEGSKLVKMQKKKITKSKNKHALKPRIVMKRVPKNTASCQS